MYHFLVNSAVSYEATMLLPTVETMTSVLYFGLFAMSFDFISGYTGYLSFGHAAFYGTGAYTVILVANGAVPLFGSGTPFMVSLLVAGLLAVVLAVLVGLVSFRLSGVYFAMITLGFAQVVYVFVRGWDYVATNPRDGPSVGSAHRAGFEIGVPGIDQLNLAIGILTGDEVSLLGQTLGSTAVSYYMVGLVVLVCYLAMQRIIHSPFGQVMLAIRENEERAVAIGYDTYRYKLAAFAISGFFAGVAGGLFAGFRRSASPENAFYFLTTGDALLASIIGGFGTLAGPLFGRLFDETIREFLSTSGQGGGLLPYLRALLGEETLGTPVVGDMTFGGLIDTLLNGHAALYVGLVFVLFVLYVPDGLLGTIRQRAGGKLAVVSVGAFGDPSPDPPTDDAGGDEQ
ncbi:branched-chain amino acid ABC transporter permease [Haloarcula nitratireducens]|uniref:Branched-chain amino acid ABC transporter permease n=1 Tax=Haloarcula nitratireducens TaxID=2487749 RepID=A0AAW4P898_9EURY|nr:branched-chain amino acid ABC transporter permease [Halomicroarcula nitratireducens]MBX0294114.1 branched-chain amino acid ABC transporter permease [Halomicroarcula nitratireducens]